jgi:dipeptidyl aminopeptidase/acylaminoacyl peptidase
LKGKGLSIWTAALGAVGLIGIAASAAVSPQQAPPATEVYLAPVRGGATPQIGVWIDISNDPDYDNQPSFLPDNSAVLFTSRRDGKQTDIYRYDLPPIRGDQASQAVTQLTHTPESEYSATVTPDRKTFSVIRVEADNTQRLWRFDLDGSNPRLVLENIKPVGYHAWMDETHLALFILGAGGGAPATLQIADTKTGKAEVAATGIGRSVLIRPGAGTVSYMTTGASRQVMEWNPKMQASTALFPPFENSQDAAWAPDGALWMASGLKIMRRAARDSDWSLVADLDTGGRGGPGVPPQFKSITRLAISPDGKWLAFVAEPVAK